MRTQPFGILVFVLSSAVLALGQNTPTGLQRVGSISLLRALAQGKDISEKKL